MSFLKSLFGRRERATAEDGPPAEGKVVREAEHGGFMIRATPYAAGGQFQVCGVIVREEGGEVRSHRFIRADRFASVDQAAEFTITKGRQIIEERGVRMFD